MKKYRSISIRGTLLEKNQLSEYIEKIAAEHNVKSSSNSDTYPVLLMKENYKFILETYKLLDRHIKLGIKVHSAGEWLLDNFYIIEETVKSIEKEMPLKKYKSMIGLSGGRFEGFARSYVLAEEIVAYTDCKIDRDSIDLALKAYQKKKFLSMDEICNIGTFFKISMISHIREICEKIYSSQMQKYKVESIIERVIDGKSGNERKFKTISNVRVFSESELKYPFIEYMSYKLKVYGKKAIEYQNVLEKEVQKLGVTLSDVIQKEHLYIANLKVKMGNCIISIKTINRIDFSELFGYINVSEEILRMDPAGVYPDMDQDSKSYYRGKIEEISKKSKISEIYICEKLIELCKRYENYSNIVEQKKAHVGYYLIDDGTQELNEILEIKHNKPVSKKVSSRLYLGSNIVIPMYLDFLICCQIYLQYGLGYWSILLWIILYIPISEIFLRISNYVMGKVKKPTRIPKISYEEGIPAELSTFVVMPTILKSEAKVKEMFDKLEVYYLANKSENLYFALLGDCSEEKTQTMDFDEKIIRYGQEYAEQLNQKYSNFGFAKFHFLYRKREWNACEKSYIGWERKRGLLVTFNKYIKGKMKNQFLVNTIENQKDLLPEIKYIITLDSDTNLSLETAQKLIGAMNHVLNIPVIENNRVVSGYGIMQPRIGLELDLAKQSKFVELFSIQGGIDFYTNAISDIYQDYFGEGIFTGKGIYDVAVYNQILDGEIEENTVLSHDLLEGNFLRCGLLTDVMLLDGYPTRYIPYILRNHRWVRGDWQIVKWLRSKRLNEISKFKIFDNLRRSLANVTCFVGIVAGTFLWNGSHPLGLEIVLWSIFALLISYILDVVNYIVFKESNIEGAVYSDKKFSKDMKNSTISVLRMLLTVLFLPYEAWKNVDAICKSLYRMKTKTKLLEWVTAEDAEKNAKTDLASYFVQMKANVFFGILVLFLGNWISTIFGILWIVAPIAAWYISLDRSPDKEISKENIAYLNEVGKQTWQFFKDHATEKNHYLMPDNYQENRKNKIVDRTSSTNIGLELLAIISAFDLGYIQAEEAIQMIYKVMETIVSLAKWNGHLYNWYNTLTLEPLIPRYVSTVDSGNFVGYLYIVKQFLLENNQEGKHDNLIQTVTDLINNTDFSKLYSPENKLMSIGFNLEDNELTDSYYDFLASEARQASFVAIAKGDVPSKVWNNLSRTLTSLKGYKGLISWTGTAFEYLMPNINLKRYEGSLLDEASKFAVLSQIEYAKKLGVPWGISESAFNLMDLNRNYQYKAFGIPWLGLKRGLEEDIVISPYSTFLSLYDATEECIHNLKRLEKEGARGKYGFYEAVDYTSSRLKKGNTHEVIRTYMAHHQGLTLLSINNAIQDNILEKRFNRNPEVQAVNVLLQEKMPVKMIITKEKKEKISKNKLPGESSYMERVIEKPDKMQKNIGVIANENYQILINDFGEGVSEYKGKMINNFKETAELKQGIFFYIRNTKTKKIMKLENCERVVFAPDKIKFMGKDANIKFEVTVTLDPDKCIEIRRVEIENLGNLDEVLEVICEFEPTLSKKTAEYAHPAFNKLFLKFEEQNENIIVERRSRDLEEFLYLATTLYTESDQIANFEYEIDGEKYQARENYGLPQMIKNQKIFSKTIAQVVSPIVAMKRTVKVKSNSKVNVNLIMAVAEEKKEAVDLIEKVKGAEEIEKILNVARIRCEEQNKYLQIKGEKLELYAKLLNYILQFNHANCKKANQQFGMNSLWKYGISGDLPILVVRVAKLEEAYVLEDIIKAFEYYRTKNIFMDLVILNNEKNVYERFVEDSIHAVIAEKQMKHLKNTSSGIFVLNEKDMPEEDVQAICFKARVVINCKNGDLSAFLKDCEEKKNQSKSEIVKPKKTKVEEEILPLREEKLLLDNGFGGFSENGKEYVIYKNTENKLPAVWSNVLANKFFGSIVTDNLGGYTWYKNSRLNRLTAWNNNVVYDFPSEIYYLKDEENGSVWTLNSSVNPNQNYYYVRHGFGYSNYQNSHDNFLQTVDVFVPNEENVKVLDFRIKNIIGEKRNLKMVVYMKPVLGEDEYFSNGNISVEKKENILLVKNVFANEDFKDKIMYVSSNEEIGTFTGDKTEFFGNGSIEEPDGLYKALSNHSGVGKDSCIGFEINLAFDKFEDKKFSILIGEENSFANIKEVTQKYEKEFDVEVKLENVKSKWNNILSTIMVKTPSESINILMNGWLVYQIIASRILARSGYYQSGGAFGFRDQLQDGLGVKYIDSSFLKDQILNCSRHQFIEGDVLHWWHIETKRGIRTRFSDDILWLVYGVLQYIETTNQQEILDEQVPYLKGELLKEDELEKYDIYYESDVKESIFEHCIRSIELVIMRGLDPFPKIGIGDWNDGFSNLGAKGQGQSIWLGFFFYDILNRFIPICEQRNRADLVEKYTKVKDELKKNLNTKGWDGRWFKRAINDEGYEIGCMASEECRIDSLAQSWSVISNAGDNDKKFISMEEAENYLVDRENKIIQLFEPAFENSSINPGYIKAYPAGIRENGGQYTHASCWFVIAEALLGFGDKAVEFAEMLNPIEHSKTKEEAKKFKLEPYVMPADVYANKDLLGRGGWNWYTGSSSWYYQAIIEYILGLKIKNGFLSMEPCIAKTWKEYEIKYKYKTSIYNITVKNKDGKNTGVEKFLLNGTEVKDKKIPLSDDGKIYQIQIFM